jgi:hypothetical protein
MQTVTSPHTKHTSRVPTYAMLRHTKQETKLLLRTPAIFPGFILKRRGHPPTQQADL